MIPRCVSWCVYPDALLRAANAIYVNPLSVMFVAGDPDFAAGPSIR